MMANGETDLHICGSCNEMFDTGESLRRHILYCGEAKPVLKVEKYQTDFGNDGNLTANHVSQYQNDLKNRAIAAANKIENVHDGEQYSRKSASQDQKTLAPVHAAKNHISVTSVGNRFFKNMNLYSMKRYMVRKDLTSVNSVRKVSNRRQHYLLMR